MKTENRPRWFSTGYLQAAPSGGVNHEDGIINGVSVTTEGEAKGHGVHLDEEFVDTVVQFGNERKQGLKARFGHPNMCSTALGTFIGRYKNFRKETVARDDGQTASRAVADLFLSNEAKDTPHGNLHKYVLNMASNEPDMFGTSIVFTPGRNYRKTDQGKKVYQEYTRGPDGENLRNTDGTMAMRWVDEGGEDVDPGKENIIERDYIECSQLHACDAVDDPAANDGLFSRFSQETLAGQITEFLDLHPQVWEALNGNDAVLSAISRYGDKVSEFFRRYEEYNIGDKDMIKEETSHSDEMEEQETEEVENSAETEGLTESTEGAADEALAEDTQEIAQEDAGEDDREFKAGEFKTLVEKFGADIASEVVLSGGSEADAYRMQADKATERIEELEREIKSLRKAQGGTAVRLSETSNNKGPVAVSRSRRNGE